MRHACFNDYCRRNWTMVISVQILNVAFGISYRASTLRKSIYPIISPPAMDK